MAFHFTDENFNQEVIESKVPVLVDFFATWCGPCKAVAPVLDELSDELKDVKIVKVDVDAEPELARSHRVMSIPTFFVYKDVDTNEICVIYKRKNGNYGIIETK